MSTPARDFPAETARALEADLRGRVTGEVRFDAGSRGLYAHDASNYRQVPIGVVIPKTVEDVVATMDSCRRHGAPVLSRGGGTSLAGQCVNVAVVIDYSKYLNRVLSLDPDRRLARVEPGCILDVLRAEAERHHLTFGPDPATHDHNTLGGMIGNNSCGIHSVMAGRTVDNVHRLRVLTHDGLELEVGPTGDEEFAAILAAGGRRAEIYRRLRALADTYGDDIRARFPDIPRRVSGFSIDQLLPENGFHLGRALVGSEGTCVAVLEAELRLVPSPPHRALLVLGYPDVYRAADHVMEIRAMGVVGLEGIDRRLIGSMRKKGLHAGDADLLPDGDGWLLAEFGGGSAEEAEDNARRAMDALRKSNQPPAMCLYADRERQARVWEIRESGLGATANVPGEPLTWPGWEDAAVHPSKVGAYLRDFRALLDRYGYDCALYGHFGDGCVHVRIDFDFATAKGVETYRRFTSDAADLVVSHGGSLSGEHGDGQSRGELLDRMYGPRLVEAFREFKAIWDPQGAMNPGKVVDPYPRDSNLAYGPDFQPPPQETEFAFTMDGGSFNRAAIRCVGVGKCRRLAGGVMCPSFMATREEKHSTRGRARLLFEMVHGGPIDDGWRSEQVHDALDLCLACKGCKHDCPVNVDMATYKAEFHRHYYQGRPRPREAWGLGLIQYWARAADLAPRLANRLVQAPGVSAAVRWAANIAPARVLPSFKPSFRRAFRHGGRRGAGRRVILFPDTFNDHFHPETLWAAVAVLERAGYAVDIPGRWLCCGRPLYVWGWIDRARSQLGAILDCLEEDIKAGIPVVGLEPACLGTFKDELQELFPDDDRAHRLGRQSFMLEDFLRAEGVAPPRLSGRALVQAHCYRKSVLGLDGLAATLADMGLEAEVLESGCCGMAGSFGFEASHYGVSMACAERVLLPAVRAAPRGTFVIADGYSCREQIIQATGREALHPAELLRLAGGTGGVT